jgi:hypothetical protein
MSRQQKILFPKLDSGVSGYQYPGSSNLFNRRGDEKPTQRVFRTRRKHVQRACERCRVKKAKVGILAMISKFHHLRFRHRSVMASSLVVGA